MDTLSAQPGGATPWRPSRSELLLDAAGFHCGEAQALAQEAARHLTVLADLAGISRDQRRRLHCLASCAELAGEGAERIGLELGTK
jgi:hypothetical protein